MSSARGLRLGSLATPALLVDLDVMQTNIAKLRSAVAHHNEIAATTVTIRPHAKAFKSSQMTQFLPYHKYCVQTVKEAEVIADGGIKDVLVTNQVIGDSNISRLTALAVRGVTVSVLVDALDHVNALEKHAAMDKCNLTALLEISTGQKRCGVNPESDLVVQIAQAIVDAPNLTWGGIQCYHGAIQHERSKVARRNLVLDGPVARARLAAAKLEAVNIKCPTITGGGTGTFTFELEGGIHNEIQPGSFLFMDGDYNQNEDSMEHFDQSLFVLATVISANVSEGRRVLDAGSKAIDLLSGPPGLRAASHWGKKCLFASLPPIPEGVEFRNGGDEHGILDNVPEDMLPLGSKVLLIPSHCDPTVNQHTSFLGMRDTVCEEVFLIDGKGWR